MHALLRAIAMLCAALGRLVAAPLTQIQTVEQMIAQQRNGPRPASEVPPEIQTKLVHATLDKQYRALLVLAAVVGVLVSLASWGFLELVHGIQHGVYKSLPSDLGYSTVPWWWPLPWLALAGVLTAFGVADQETLEALSKKLGHMRMVEQVSTGAVGSALTSGAAAFRDDRHDVPLLADYEISRIFKREQKRMLILGTGSLPVAVERFIYHDPKDELFRELYDELPF